MKIICIGRNYAEHAKELNNEIPEEPVFFLKPETALIPKNQPFFIPDFSRDIHYEAELVIKICRTGKFIDQQFAHRYYNEITVGIDFTARDVQQELKKKGLPWEKAKAFDWSAPVGMFVPITDLPDPSNIHFKLFKNQQLVQDGKSSQMIFNFDQIVSYVSQFITLKIGDLIFTGTPSGVGKVEKNDLLTATLEGKEVLSLKIK
ncbi:MAG: 2-hydroxyhepta-2,4-diene-1,7-dioate isomerase [Vicingaceae bacterium]|nr:MAG: 2-hydroxyhepta-2,4-diene-1,7-dioate isomerase [Vicingaceae bacterium]